MVLKDKSGLEGPDRSPNFVRREPVFHVLVNQSRSFKTYVSHGALVTVLNCIDLSYKTNNLVNSKVNYYSKKYVCSCKCNL